MSPCAVEASRGVWRVGCNCWAEALLLCYVAELASPFSSQAPSPLLTGDTINVVPGQTLIRGENLASTPTYLSFVPAPQPLPIAPGLQATFFLSPSLLYVSLPTPATLAPNTNCNATFTLFNVTGTSNTEKHSPFTNCSLSEDGLGVTLHLPGTAGESTDSIDVAANQIALTVGTLAVQPLPGPRTRVTSVYLDTAFLVAAGTIRLRFTRSIHLPANLTAARCNSVFGIYTAASNTPKADAFASCFQPFAEDATVIHLTLAAGTAFESGDRMNVIDGQSVMRLLNPSGPFIPAQQRYTDIVPVLASAIATSPTTVIVTLPLNSTLTSGCNVHLGKATNCSISIDDPTKLILTSSYEANDKVYINTNAPSLSYGSTRYGWYDNVQIQPSIWSARLTGPNTLSVSLAGVAALPANASCSSILSIAGKPDAISSCSLAYATLYATLSPSYTYSPTDTINIVQGQSSLTTPELYLNSNPGPSFVPNPAGPLAILPSVSSAVLLDTDVTHGSFTLVVTLPLASSIFTPGSNPAPAATLPSCSDIFTLSSISSATVTSCSSNNPNGPSTTLTVTAAGAYNASGFLNIATTNGAGSGPATLASLRTGASASTGVLYAPLAPPTPLLPSMPASAIATTPTTILVTLPFASYLRDAVGSQKPALTASECASIFSIPTKTILSCELGQRTLRVLLDPATPFTPGDILSLTPTHSSPNQPSLRSGNLAYAPRPDNSTTTIRPTITSAVFDTRTRVLLTLAVPGYLYNASGAVQPQLQGEDSPGSDCNAVLELSGALALAVGAGACVVESAAGGATTLAITVADPSAFTGGASNLSAWGSA